MTGFLADMSLNADEVAVPIVLCACYAMLCTEAAHGVWCCTGMLCTERAYVATSSAAASLLQGASTRPTFPRDVRYYCVLPARATQCPVLKSGLVLPVVPVTAGLDKTAIQPSFTPYGSMQGPDSWYPAAKSNARKRIPGTNCTEFAVSYT
eukprot:2321186-Rhodomonas_salina.2